MYGFLLTSGHEDNLIVSDFPKPPLNNHRLKPVGLNYGLKVRIRVDWTTRLNRVPSWNHRSASAQSDAPNTALSFLPSSGLPWHRSTLSPRNAGPNISFSGAETLQTACSTCAPWSVSWSHSATSSVDNWPVCVHGPCSPHPWLSWSQRLHRLSNQLSYPLRYLASENLVAVLRNPYKVTLNLKYRMTAVSVLHAAPPFVQPILAAKADRLKPVV